MGWLFAVALGLQEQKRAAVLRALLPIALGHALSIGIIIAAVLVARISLPHSALKYSAAAILFAFGLYRLFRSRHPNWVGMRVGFGDLTLWSFIMASAHGAGLMLIPLFLKSADALNSCKPDELTHAFDVEFRIRQCQFAISADRFNRNSYVWLPSGNWLGGDVGL